MNNFLNFLNSFRGLKRQSSFSSHYHRLFTISGVISAADSVYVLFFPMKQQFIGSFGSLFIANCVALAVIFAYLYIVDFSLMKFLPGTIAGLVKFRTFEGNKKALIFGTLIFCLVQTYATIYVSKTLRHSAVAIVSEKPKTQDITALTANANAAQAEKVKAAEKEIARINSEKESAVASVSKKGAKMAAWGTGGSYADRMKAYNAQVKSVEADYQAKKKSAGSAFEERLKKAEATKAAALTDPALGASIAAANRVNEFEINNYMTKTESFSDFLLKISLYSTAILWFTGAMIGFAAAAGGIGLVPSLLGESNEQHSGAASMALASGASTGLLPSQYKKHTAELSAVHEAGHFVANAYMNAVGVNSKIEIEKISIESDGAVGSLGVVVAYFTYDQCHTNTCLRLAMLTAGLAAEYVALGNGVTPTQYLKAAEYEKLPSHSDLGQFNEIIKKESLNTTFERVYLETVKWLQGDNAMLQVVTSEILSKRCIEGDAVKALFRNCENWYRSKEGKELIVTTPSVEAPKTAEKTVIEPKTAVITGNETVITEKETKPSLPATTRFLNLGDYTKHKVLKRVQEASADINIWILEDAMKGVNPILELQDGIYFPAINEMPKIMDKYTDLEAWYKDEQEVKNAQKTVITAETTVITEKTAEKQFSEPIELEITHSTSDSWLSKLTTIEVGGKTYSPAEIVKAKTYVLTYWKRVFEAKSEAAEERNRIRVEEYRNVLEATGAIVNLNEDGTGSVTI